MYTNKMKAIFVSMVLTAMFALLPTASACANDNISALPQTEQTQQSAPPDASGWRTINGPYGLRLSVPSSWH